MRETFKYYIYFILYIIYLPNIYFYNLKPNLSGNIMIHILESFSDISITFNIVYYLIKKTKEL